MYACVAPERVIDRVLLPGASAPHIDDSTTEIWSHRHRVVQKLHIQPKVIFRYQVRMADRAAR